MMNVALKQLKIALVLCIVMMAVTGVLYPLLITAIAQLSFPWKANGSLIKRNGEIIGSKLIGQSFTAPGYFWGRPSATTPFAYNAALSAGSNLGPSNPVLINNVTGRIAALRAFPTKYPFVPVDLVTASSSGLDPDISPLAAYYQVPRVAMVRGVTEIQLQELINQFIVRRLWGFLGEPRINVLQLNLALDYFFPNKGTS